MSKLKVLNKVDLLGATLSFGCAIHCMLLPLVITFLPLLGLGVLSHGAFEQGMFIVSISLATVSLCWGMRIHREFRLFALLAAGIVLFALGGFHAHESKEAILVAFGGFCLATAHYINRRLCHSCHSCETHSH